MFCSGLWKDCVFSLYTLQHILIEDLLITLQLQMKLCSPHTLEQSTLFLFLRIEDRLLTSIMPQLFLWSVYYFSEPVSTWDSWVLTKQRSFIFFPFTLFWIKWNVCVPNINNLRRHNPNCQRKVRKGRKKVIYEKISMKNICIRLSQNF